ncbi:MAG: cyclic nucleotide-binding domain-containing protein [Anaerolineae bacterium]|nr:cyclic nucleotide-binding domain-containing protein [Anaerolineae bacterium]
MRKVLYILSELSDADVEWMIAHGRRERRPAGSVLIQEGGSIESLYILLDGQLVVSVGTSGRELARLSAGEVVGEVSFVDLRPPSATVKVTEDALLLVIPRDELNAKLQSDDGFAARFYRALAVFLAYRLRDTVAQLGYGEERQPFYHEEDELDPNVLDKVYLAGQRFARILKRLGNPPTDSRPAGW